MIGYSCIWDMLNKIKHNIFVILILTLGLVLAFINYTPGTFLSGWDTLHPEFNFGLAFERQISGVFRIEQGLGAVAAHSHMADLPHTTILYLLSFIFPMNTLRYLYIFLTLIAGPVGMYFFLNKFVIKDKISSFLGSTFYLLNLGTIQIFAVPFEMFTTQYAVLPWLFLFATEYIYSKEKSLNKLLLFSLITFLATPMAYAATLWYVWFFIFILYLACLNLFDRSFSILKKSLILISTTLAINSFWILPNLYFALNYGKEISEALINQLFSPQAFLYNKEFGNIKDIALMKNFLFDWNVYGGKDFIPLLLPWINHLKQMPIQLIGFFFALVAFAGIITGYLKKNKILISLLFPLLFCLFFLINDNPPTDFLYNFLQNKIPLFKEAFRFPDDKILGIFTFVFALYFAQGQKMILNFLKKFKIVYLLIILSLIAYYNFPAFKGNLISPFMRVEIPKDYFKMFDWFNNQEKTARVANLPIQSPWGWEYYNWYSNKPSFQGADFLQFGIKQPLLNRDFDRWNKSNEQYYREMAQAIYSQNSAKLINVLKKYNIKYVFLDKSVIAPEQGNYPQILFLKETKNLLENNSNVQQVFNSGSLSVYQVNTYSQNVQIMKNPVSVEQAPSVSYDDFVYSKYGDYVTYSDPSKNAVTYPFGNIINNENQILSGFNFSSFSAVGKEYNVVLSNNPTNDCSAETSVNSESKMKILQDGSGKFIRYSSPLMPLCNRYSFPNIPREKSYLVSVTSKNISGLPLKLCVQNFISKRCDLFTQLSPFSTFKEEKFLLPPMEKGVGFDIILNNFAIKGSPAINDLLSIKIIPFPYAEVSQIEKYNPEYSFKDTSFIAYSQSFDKDWKAYEMKNINLLTSTFPSLFGKELKEHVLVNNWANGWEIPSSKSKVQSSKYIIVFWPQYLEYLGFAILIGTFTWIILSVRKKQD
jgi:hypothetical protein